MPQPFPWIELLDRFGVAVGVLAVIAVFIWKFSAWIGPIITNYIDRKQNIEEKKAEAAMKNAETLAVTSEKSLVIQEENAQTNKRFADMMDVMVPIVKRLDQITFSPKTKP